MRASVSVVVAKAQAAAAQVLRLSVALGSFVKNLEKTDSVTTSETKVLVVTKALTDVASVLETVAKGLTRTVSDTYTASDAKSITFTKAANEVASAADTYSRVIGKVLADTVRPTDDVDVTTADDEQNIQLTKRFEEAVALSDVFTKTVEYLRSLSDGVTTSDTAAKTITKSFDDVVTVVESINIGQGVIAGYDSAASVIDAAVREFSKVLSDSAAASDLASKEFGKAPQEAVSQSDAAVKVAGKGLTDVSSTSDSGSLFTQNYVSEDYFAERYVGIEQTF